MIDRVCAEFLFLMVTKTFFPLKERLQISWIFSFFQIMNVSLLLYRTTVLSVLHSEMSYFVSFLKNYFLVIFV